MFTRSLPKTHGVDAGAAALAPVLVSTGLGLLRTVVWLTETSLGVGERFLAAGVELCHWLLLGVYFGGAFALSLRLARSARWIGRAGSVFVLYLACLLVLGHAIGGDLSGFAARQTLLPGLLVAGLGAGLSPLVPLVVAALSLAARRLGARVVLACFGAFLFVGSAFVLQHDYPAVHFLLALVAGALALPLALSVRVSRRATVGTVSLAAALAAGWFVLGTPPHVAPALVNDTGAAASPIVEGLRHAVFPRVSRPHAPTGSRGEWFVSRAKLPPRAPRPSAVERPLVILLSVDALRSHVVTEGHHDRLLPTFAALRKRSVVFSNARSPATLTKISMASLFRGSYFSQQHWVPRREDLFTPKDKTVTFSELLEDAGVDTWNVRTIAWLKNGPLFRGFGHQPYAKGNSRYATADAALPELMRALDAVGDGPAFVFTHLSDPHAPYERGGRKLTDFQRYLREVEFVDQHLGKLLDHVQERGLAERTFVIVTADHGEEFGEHRAQTHGTTLYDAALRVPLFISGPGIEPRLIEDNVTTLDLGPTILDLFGVPTPAAMMGESLLGVALGEAPRFTRPIAAETRLLRAWVTPEKLKVIWDTQSGRVEAYDLGHDPGETKNLFGQSEAAERAFTDLQVFFSVHAFKKKGYKPPFFR